MLAPFLFQQTTLHPHFPPSLEWHIFRLQYISLSYPPPPSPLVRLHEVPLQIHVDITIVTSTTLNCHCAKGPCSSEALKDSDTFQEGAEVSLQLLLP